MAILVGSRTARVDNPKLTTRLIQGKNPLRIVLQGDEPLDTAIELLADNEETLVFGSEVDSVEFPKEWIQLTKNQAPLPQILNTLYERNIQSLLVEGGAYTLQQFIDADLWDEAYVLIGNKELKEGKLAPRLESKMVKSFTIFGDKVHHFKNVKNDLVTA
jgi:diaminohydroxyphosphoribosylaminopyrimidine deaminase/5-amino-6-(5-phosphoribosylamino)uracil reductase